MIVEQLMTRAPATCREDDSLDTAASMMRDRDCGAIPIVDDHHVIIGMITDRDICMAAYDLQRQLRDIAVAEVASEEVCAVLATDTVQRAEELMRDHQVRRLPVVDDHDRVIGVLSFNDIVRQAERERPHRSLKRSIHSDEIVHTLAAICRPTPSELPRSAP